MRFVLMTSPLLHARGPRPLTSPGLVHILATPRPVSPCGMPPILPHFCTTKERASVFPLHADPSNLLQDANGQLHAPFPLFQKTRSCFHNPVHLRRNSLRHYCTFHGKSDFPCFFFSVFLLRRPTGYLLLQPRRLNRGERAFCGIEPICIANQGPCARMTAPYRDFKAYSNSVILVNVK